MSEWGWWMPKVENRRPTPPRTRCMLQKSGVDVLCELRIYDGLPISGNGVAMREPSDNDLCNLIADCAAELRFRRRE